MDKASLGLKIGILGGGQLARMLAQAGAELGFEMHVYSGHAADPAAQVVQHWTRGELSDVANLRTFIASVDLVTIESEFVDTRILKQAATKPIFPVPDDIALFSDRASQKKWLVDQGIPTAPYLVPNSPDKISAFLAQHKKGIVIKKRRFGYDGYGTTIVRKTQDLNIWLKKIEDDNLQTEDHIAEAFVPFRRELALQFAVNPQGQVLMLPLVEWRAQDSKCLWAMGPISDRRMTKLSKTFVRALKKQNYVGVIAFEIFDSASGLVVNEVAPRVHNSGHHSIESCAISQFQAHLLAITGAPLPPTTQIYTGGFAMLNLIGSSDRPAEILNSPHLQKTPASLHWYGKKDNRQGRKMGHITRLSQSPKKALNEVLGLKRNFRI